MMRKIRAILRPRTRPKGAPGSAAPGLDSRALRDRTLVIGLGAMKSGTTWLSHYLSTHPQFLLSPIKEMDAFSQLYENPFKGQTDKFRLFQMERLVLDEDLEGDPRARDKLRALAQLGRLATVEDYLAYFAERARDHTHFGEISPSYSHLPPEALRDMAALTSDVRFLFVMRDPTQRAASHIRHMRRREWAHLSIADAIGQLGPEGDVYRRSDYAHTLDAIAEAGLEERTRFLFYESLFDVRTVADLCGWLGLPFRDPKPEQKRNEGRGETLSPEQLAELRHRLDPIYVDLLARGLAAKAPGWWWDAPPLTAAGAAT